LNREKSAFPVARLYVEMRLTLTCLVNRTPGEHVYAQASRPVFMIEDNTVTVPDRFASLARDSVKVYGGRYLAGGSGISIDGEPPKGRVVLIEWDSMEQLLKWRRSAEYAEAPGLQRRGDRQIVHRHGEHDRVGGAHLRNERVRQGDMRLLLVRQFGIGLTHRQVGLGGQMGHSSGVVAGARFTIGWPFSSSARLRQAWPPSSNLNTIDTDRRSRRRKRSSEDFRPIEVWLHDATK
jgi:uncharacterized protein (DUF1330 family)